MQKVFCTSTRIRQILNRSRAAGAMPCCLAHCAASRARSSYGTCHTAPTPSGSKWGGIGRARCAIIALPSPEATGRVLCGSTSIRTIRRGVRRVNPSGKGRSAPSEQRARGPEAVCRDGGSLRGIGPMPPDKLHDAGPVEIGDQEKAAADGEDDQPGVRLLRLELVALEGQDRSEERRVGKEC